MLDLLLLTLEYGSKYYQPTLLQYRLIHYISKPSLLPSIINFIKTYSPQQCPFSLCLPVYLCCREKRWSQRSGWIWAGERDATAPASACFWSFPSYYSLLPLLMILILILFLPIILFLALFMLLLWLLPRWYSTVFQEEAEEPSPNQQQLWARGYGSGWKQKPYIRP